MKRNCIYLKKKASPGKANPQTVNKMQAKLIEIGKKNKVYENLKKDRNTLAVTQILRK